MKITKEQKEQILELASQGKKQREIAETLGISQATVGYWASEEVRKKKIKSNTTWFKKKSKEERRIVYKQRLEYQRKYQHERYTNDPIFRKKQLERVKRK